MSPSSDPEKNKNHLNDLTGKEWIRHTISWFTLKPRSRTAPEMKHPGKFPEELAERFISFFTKKGQWVLDPFLGVGSTLLACRALDRNGVGIEVNPDFVQVAEKALEQEVLFPTTRQEVICGNSLELDNVLRSKFGDSIPEFSFCVTSPPYWNMLAKHRGGSNSQHRERKEKGLPLVYSTDIEADISNIEDYDQYLEAVVRVFANLKPYMKKNGYIVVVLQNIRDEMGEYVPIAWDFSYKMKSFYKPRQEQIWCQTDKRTGIWGYPITYVSNVHHHYCVVFQNT